MSETVLLGAGASMDAGVPSAKPMTGQIVDSLDEMYRARDVAPLLKFALGGLLLAQGSRGENPLAGVDVEELFAAVEFLGQRGTHEVSAFVGTWHSALTSIEQRIVHARMTEEEMQEERRAKVAVRQGTSPFPAPSQQPYDRRRKEGQEFRELADHMLEALERIVVVSEDEKVEYLVPLAKHAARNPNTYLATLNYDNCIERAASAADVAAIETGVNQWNECGRLHLNNDSSRLTLLKLHGSINWRLRDWRSNERPLPHKVLVEQPWERLLDKRPGGIPSSVPGLVFGARSKLRPDGPFLALLRAFSDALSQSSALTVIGYSFRDAHINAELTTWLNHDADRRVRIVDPSFAGSSVEYVQHLQTHVGDRVDHYDMNADEGIAELFSN